MKNSKLLYAVLGGLLAGTAMMIVFGLFNLDAIAATPLNHLFFLPHMVMANIVRDPTLQDRHLEFVLPVFFAAHAVVVLLAVLVAGIASARGRETAWGAPLAFGLGGISFYVAHFCFLHPAGPMAPAGAGVRVLDFLAVALLATGVWSLLRFFLVFPREFNAAGFDAFIQRQIEQQHTAVASSRFALRRWLSRGMDARSRERSAALQRRQLAFIRSAWFPGAIAVLGAALLVLAPRIHAFGKWGFIPAAILGYSLLLLVIVAFSFGASVLEWHRREGGPVERKCAAAIWWSATIAMWTCLAVLLAAMVAILAFTSPVAIGFFFLSVPAGVLVVALTFVIAVAIATWSAPRIPAAGAS